MADTLGQVAEHPLLLLTALGAEIQQVRKGGDLPLAARTLSQLLKRHFDAAADRLDDLLDQYHLRQASTHWLRHTAATEMIGRGAQVAVVQEILGHSNSATTASQMYEQANADLIMTHEEMSKLRAERESLVQQVAAGTGKLDALVAQIESLERRAVSAESRLEEALTRSVTPAKKKPESRTSRA